MPFFTQPTDFSVIGSSLTDVAGDLNVHISPHKYLRSGPLVSIAQIRKKDNGKKKRGGFPIIKRKHLELQRQLHKGVGYRLHLGRRKGKAVVVKIFEDSNSEKHCAAAVAFSRRIWHSNIAQLIGISSEGCSTPFAVFSASKSTMRIQPLIAEALRTDLNRSVELSLKMVKGIAAGLHYIGSQGISLRSLVTRIDGLEHYDILCSKHGEPVLSISPGIMDEPQNEATHRWRIQSKPELDNWVVFEMLCERTFKEVNSILYNDTPERIPLKMIEAHSSFRSREFPHLPDADKPTRSMFESKQEPSRREVLWNFIQNNQRSLASVSKQFEEYIDLLPPTSRPLLPHIRGSRAQKNRVPHRCSGYLREEITLTSDVARSAIVLHAEPMENERCTGCGKLVEYRTWVPIPALELVAVAEALAAT